MTRRASDRRKPLPFLKWAGGKRSMLGHILPRLPKTKIPLYIEPFLGGGAVFLALAHAGLIERAILGDQNPELVNAWLHVRDYPEALIEAVRALGEAESERYYRVRADEPSTDLGQAARMLWLNRTCFNGLYRLNKSGKFNVPFGRYKSPRMINPENIWAVSQALRETNAEIRLGEFSELMLSEATGTDAVVYCDPPYMPVKKTSFTAYTHLPFRLAEHTLLADTVVTLKERGVKVLLSNACTPETEALYAARGLDKVIVDSRRNINRDAKKRGKVPELLVGANLRLEIPERPPTAS